MVKQLVLVSISFVFALVLAATPSIAQDEERLTVIELFTSQGCSSCPPADAALRSMRDRPNILTLSWAVDYWDRLGWEDTFALPNHMKRQTAYSKRFGRGGIYTPQMVFDGIIQAIGSQHSAIKESIELAKTADHINVTPVLDHRGDKISLSLPSTEDLDDMVSIRVVWYLRDAEVDISRGENEGRRLHYTNVVRGSDIVMDWKGNNETIELDLETGLAAGADHVAVLLQQGYGHGPIIGAATMPLTVATNLSR